MNHRWVKRRGVGIIRWSWSCGQESLSSGSASREGLKQLDCEDVMDNIESVPPAVSSRSHHWTLFVAGIATFRPRTSLVCRPVSSKESRIHLVRAGSVLRRHVVIDLVGAAASQCRADGISHVVRDRMWFGVVCVHGRDSKSGIYGTGSDRTQSSAICSPVCGRRAIHRAADLETGTSTVMVFYRGRW